MKQTQEEIGSSIPYICGGTPRDKYLKRVNEIADLDITTGDGTVDYLSQEFELRLRKTYNVTRKTMSDGHSTIFIGNLKVDFSSNFMVPNIDSYLARLRIHDPSNMQREMFSRDFTCNSLLLDFNLKDVRDPTHMGFKDLDKKIIRTCLPPEVTLTSNRNRVVRAIYLACKLGFHVDDSIIKFVVKNPEVIKISTDKVMIEKLNDAFQRDPDRASFLLTKMNLWNYIPITEKVHPYYMKHVKGNIDVK